MAKQKFTKFNWLMPKIMATLPEGEHAEKLYQAIQENEKSFPQGANLGFLDYNSEAIRGSNPLRNGQIYFLVVDSGLRTAMPGDDVNGDIFRFVEGEYCADFNALVSHEKKPFYEKNNGLWKRVNELAEESQGTIKFSFMVQGFHILPGRDENNCGVTFLPADNFRIIEDERLSGKYDGLRFTQVDELGLPKDLHKSKGDRTWNTRNDGLARAYVSGRGDLNFGYDNLAYSDDIGRVVLVSAKSDAPNFQAKLREIQKII